MNYKVAILIGSDTDRPILEKSLPYFKFFNVDLIRCHDYSVILLNNRLFWTSVQEKFLLYD